MSRVHVFKRVGKYASAAENLSKGLMLCECRRVAVIYRSGEFICQTCIDLQKEDYNRRYHAVVGVKSKIQKKLNFTGITEAMWDGDMKGFAKEELYGWGPTINFLNQLERKAA